MKTCPVPSATKSIQTQGMINTQVLEWLKLRRPTITITGKEVKKKKKKNWKSRVEVKNDTTALRQLGSFLKS